MTAVVYPIGDGIEESCRLGRKGDPSREPETTLVSKKRLERKRKGGKSILPRDLELPTSKALSSQGGQQRPEHSSEHCGQDWNLTKKLGLCEGGRAWRSS